MASGAESADGMDVASDPCRTLMGWQFIPFMDFRDDLVKPGPLLLSDALQIGTEDAFAFSLGRRRDGIESFVASDLHGFFAKWWPGATDEERSDVICLSFSSLGDQARTAINRMADILLAVHRHRNGRPYSGYDMLSPVFQEMDLTGIGRLADREVLEAAWDSGRYRRFRRIMTLTTIRTQSFFARTPRAMERDLADAVLEARGDRARLRELVPVRRCLRDMGGIGAYDLTPPTGRIAKRARRALRRAMGPCGRMVGRRRMADFLNGHEIEVPGIRFDYRVMNVIGAVRHGMNPERYHVPFRLTVFRKDGRRVGTGCVYFEGAPILDQLTALRLHASDPATEDAMLSRMNLTFPQPAMWGSGLEDRFLACNAHANPEGLDTGSYIDDLSEEEEHWRRRSMDVAADLLRDMVPLPGEGVERILEMPQVDPQDMRFDALNVAMAAVRIGRTERIPASRLLPAMPLTDY